MKKRARISANAFVEGESPDPRQRRAGQNDLDLEA